MCTLRLNFTDLLLPYSQAKLQSLQQNSRRGRNSGSVSHMTITWCVHSSYYCLLSSTLEVVNHLALTPHQWPTTVNTTSTTIEASPSETPHTLTCTTSSTHHRPPSYHTSSHGRRHRALTHTHGGSKTVSLSSRSPQHNIYRPIRTPTLLPPSPPLRSPCNLSSHMVSPSQ